MTFHVVDALEPVEVEAEDGEPLVPALRPPGVAVDQVHHQAPVGQVRQRIVQRQVGDPRLGALANGDIADREQFAVPSVRQQDPAPADLGRKPVAVGAGEPHLDRILGDGRGALVAEPVAAFEPVADGDPPARGPEVQHPAGGGVGVDDDAVAVDDQPLERAVGQRPEPFRLADQAARDALVEEGAGAGDRQQGQGADRDGDHQGGPRQPFGRARGQAEREFDPDHRREVKGQHRQDQQHRRPGPCQRPPPAQHAMHGRRTQADGEHHRGDDDVGRVLESAGKCAAAIPR